MCSAPCVALPSMVEGKRATHGLSCRHPSKSYKREGYTWWSTHGFAADILQKWKKKKTMCRPPCVALPFWNLWSEERRLHMVFFFVHFQRMSAGKTMCSRLPSDQRFQKGRLHMVFPADILRKLKF